MVYNANEETKSVNAGYLNSREDTFLISLPTGIVSSAEVLLENVQTKAFLITHITNILELSMFVKKYINAKIAIEVIKHYNAWPEYAFSLLLDWRWASGRVLTLSNYVPILSPALKVSFVKIGQNYEQMKIILEEALSKKKVFGQDYFQLNV